MNIFKIVVCRATYRDKSQEQTYFPYLMIPHFTCKEKQLSLRHLMRIYSLELLIQKDRQIQGSLCIFQRVEKVCL